MAGFETLLTGGSALDAVQKAVEHMEVDETRFNAGRGAVLNAEGEVLLDAAIMNGADLKAGAVACVPGVLHAIALARGILESAPHVMLVGDGARAFAEEAGVATCSPASLIVERERERYERAKEVSKSGGLDQVGGPADTVGAVAFVRAHHGHVSAATSTGGSLLKLPGRVGDPPLIGAGLYADDRRGAGSSTGLGEGITFQTKSAGRVGDPSSRFNHVGTRPRRSGAASHGGAHARVPDPRTRRYHPRRFQRRAWLCFQYTSHGLRLFGRRHDATGGRDMKGPWLALGLVILSVSASDSARAGAQEDLAGLSWLDRRMARRDGPSRHRGALDKGGRRMDDARRFPNGGW